LLVAQKRRPLNSDPVIELKRYEKAGFACLLASLISSVFQKKSRKYSASTVGLS
jgi:hypothetical protein